jgi:hypothetical protein
MIANWNGVCQPIGAKRQPPGRGALGESLIIQLREEILVCSLWSAKHIYES